MAIYDGFFDATRDEMTGEYDRAYSSDDFTQYFAQIIGSGVCVHDNPNSFLVRMEGGSAVVSPGYLFIRGYWCKNDADYTVNLPETGTYAIVAHLNLGKRMIELEARSVEQAYADSLVLAIVSPTSAEDTRYNTDICGVIDTAGELSDKVKWAINYIDNEVDGKLAEAERKIAAQSAKLDEKIAEVQAVADSIIPPPIGTIKFSASQHVGKEWLKCDGRFVSESDYPELVEALGKLIPSGDKFQLLSDGEIGSQISNGVLYGGRMWVYSYSTKKLYGVDVGGKEAVKEVTLTSDSPYFSNFRAPSTAYPICLSIVPHKAGSGAMIFLGQRPGENLSGSSEYDWLSGLLLFQAEFTGSENSLQFSIPFTTLEIPVNSSSGIEPSISLPYVVSVLKSGVEKYVCAVGKYYTRQGSTASSPQTHYFAYIEFGSSEAAVQSKELPAHGGSASDPLDGDGLRYQRSAFSTKTKNESVFACENYGGSGYAIRVTSIPDGAFTQTQISAGSGLAAASQYALNVVGPSKMIAGFTRTSFPVIPISESGGIRTVNHDISLPSAARIFVDGGVYLWGKDIYMIFVGTGIIFSRTLEEGSFGYLDTTSVLGTITQFGYLDYSQDEGTLYLLGQDTTNRVKVAKIVLNTLYDYANDGAWLPMIASDGVPAYIKAKEAE